jgi:hypothetical protein
MLTAQTNMGQMHSFHWHGVRATASLLEANVIWLKALNLRPIGSMSNIAFKFIREVG